MRSIAKLAPPANVSPPGQASSSMVQREQAYKTSLQTTAAGAQSVRARTDFNAMHKPSLCVALAREQRGLCVYCERPLDLAGKTPVEHWRPLAKDWGDALNWDNLYLSCPTGGTCDDTKGGTRLWKDDSGPSLPWPIQTNYEDWVGFTTSGDVYVRTDAPITPDERAALRHAIKTIVNINHPTLQAAREAAIDVERGRLAEPNALGPTLAQALLAEPSWQSFVSVRVATLLETLGQAEP